MMKPASAPSLVGGSSRFVQALELERGSRQRKRRSESSTVLM
jgi:hypothetical protein